jgi:hypothetical protein
MGAHYKSGEHFVFNNVKFKQFNYHVLKDEPNQYIFEMRYETVVLNEDDHIAFNVINGHLYNKYYSENLGPGNMIYIPMKYLIRLEDKVEKIDKVNHDSFFFL